MNRFLPLALLVPVLACASAQARTPLESAPLEVPPVPPRLITPPIVPEPPPAEPVVDVPPASLPVPSRTAKPREAPRADPKTEPKTETVSDGVPPQAPPPAVGPLRLTGTAGDPEPERQVREILGRALKLLTTVDTRSFSEGRMADLDAARNFIKQAEDSVKAANWVVAKSLAERAETLAKLLAGR